MEELKRQDGQEVSVSFAEEWGLSYFDIKNGKAFVDFVGLIIKKDKVLLSFPKHYDFNTAADAANDMKGILTLLAKGKSSSSDKKESQNFPIDAYLSVQNYYRKYGLHFVTIKEKKKGYNGQIDWRRTIRKSDKVAQENGIAFLPFIITKVKDINVFLAECMEYVLNETYSTFSDYLDFLTPYQKRSHNPIFSNFSRCVKELKLIHSKFFKDTEKNLIDGLIRYFEWKAEKSDKFTIAVTDFERYWESMIELYLNHCFVGFKENHEIIWGEGGKIEFKKTKQRYIEDRGVCEEKTDSPWRIEFDHIHINNEDKVIYLLDSKYIYKDGFLAFNYKQAFYYYYLKQYYQGYTIYNGLVAPTEKEYHHKLHVNRADRPDEFFRYDDGLLIYEHYVNLADVIEFSKNHLAEFKNIIEKTDSRKS